MLIIFKFTNYIFLHTEGLLIGLNITYPKTLWRKSVSLPHTDIWNDNLFNWYNVNLNTQILFCDKWAFMKKQIKTLLCLSYNQDLFSVLRTSHSDSKLKVLESLYIKSCQPSLCKQKVMLLGSSIIKRWCLFIYNIYIRF